MMRLHSLALALLAAGTIALPVMAQTPAAIEAPEAQAPSADEPGNSALTAELFYELLIGELNFRGDEPGIAFSLLLDAARKTNDARLFQRTIDVALQTRSADLALQAARAWRQAMPTSREANRYILQILIAINRIGDTLEPLRNEIAGTDPKDRTLAISVIPRNYARVTDKKAAAALVEQALGPYLKQPDTAAAAWTALGRMRLSAEDTPGALDAAQRGQQADARAPGPVLLALEIMDPKYPAAETIVRSYLEQPAPVEIRMSYARALLDSQRYAEASQQMQKVTAENPNYAEAWLVQGTLQMQDNQLAAAAQSLARYVELAQSGNSTAEPEERQRGLVQAYLALSQLAEKQKDFAAAERWLDRIPSSEDLFGAQSRRASILARRGKMAEARALLQALPQRNPDEARRKLVAEVQLLRENQQFRQAYELLGAAIAKDATDLDLLYDQAMLADKLRKYDEMERLLRQVVAAKPDFHHAYNALGYSLAERGTRLGEARELIVKALEFAPGDPFISDSLGWVEFRMGNKTEALRILETAYKARPDAEIGAHLGEVLWSMGERTRATAVWKDAIQLNPDNETLLETLKRLSVRL